jgi:amphi-Trp domain-containing protein
MIDLTRFLWELRPLTHTDHQQTDRRHTMAQEKEDRDIEKTYPINEFIAKLRRLADALEEGKQFNIQIAGERIYVPTDAVYNIEHEREGDAEEIEFQIKWKN